MVVEVFGVQIWPLLPKNFKWRQIQYYITVEPLGLLLYMGLYTLTTVQPTLQECRMTATYEDSLWDKTWDKGCPKDTCHYDYEAFDNMLQKEIVGWNQKRLAANIPTAIIVSAFLGAWSDKHGRQFLILMGCSALMIGYCFAQVILYSYTVMAPLWWWIVLTFFEGLMGNYQLSYFAGQSYQSDIVIDKHELTLRMNIVSIFRSIGAGLGSYLTAILAFQAGYIMWVSVGNSIIFLAFCYIFFWVPQLPPLDIEKAFNDYAVEAAGNRERVETLFKKDGRAATMLSSVHQQEVAHRSGNLFVNVMKDLGQQYKDCWETYSVPRPGYKRACIWIMVLIGFISTLAGNEAGQLWGQYTRFIMHWQGDTYGKWQTVNIVVGTVGQLIGILVMKSWLRMRDTWILVVALLSFGLSFIPQATTSDTLWDISNYIQIFAAIISPTTSSLATCFVKPHEVGRVLLGINTSWYLANIGSQYGLQFLYEATLNWYPGFMFLIVAILNLACIPMLIWIDFVEKASIVNAQMNIAVDDIVADEINELDEVERRGTRAYSATNRGAGLTMDPDPK